MQHVDIGALNKCAGGAGGELWLAALPGTFVHEASPLVHVRRAPGEEGLRGIRSAFTLGGERSFDQDPRFGLIVLTEIASRALSPAVNDPGTAISVIGRLVRILSGWRERPDPKIEYGAVIVPAIEPVEMIEDAFRPIARDGAGIVGVQIRLQKGLQALQDIAPAVFGAAAGEMARDAEARAGDALCDIDRRHLERAARGADR